MSTSLKVTEVASRGQLRVLLLNLKEKIQKVILGCLKACTLQTLLYVDPGCGLTLTPKAFCQVYRALCILYFVVYPLLFLGGMHHPHSHVINICLCEGERLLYGNVSSVKAHENTTIV